MPYDRFTTEMLAGDLLPAATRAQMIATGFHRNTTTNTEGRRQRRGIPLRGRRRSRQHDNASLDAARPSDAHNAIITSMTRLPKRSIIRSSRSSITRPIRTPRSLQLKRLALASRRNLPLTRPDSAGQKAPGGRDQRALTRNGPHGKSRSIERVCPETSPISSRCRQTSEHRRRRPPSTRTIVRRLRSGRRAKGLSNNCGPNWTRSRRRRSS